jgi:hypothetical protein
MRTVHALGSLFLNGQDVGTVKVRGWNSSWGIGDFTPNENFSQFAPIFGNWSLLMHADADQQKLTDAASEELRQAEYQIDSLHARLFFSDTREWHDLRQLNIDGSLIEWKQP